MRSSVRIRTAAVIAVALIAAAGCDSGNKPIDDSGSKPIDKVGYVTGFGTFGREAEAWVADQKGFFKDANIQVDIQVGYAGESNTTLLEADKVQFALVDFGTLLHQVGIGRHTNIRALAAIQQRTVSGVITLQGKGITSPKDLAGKKIAYTPGSALQVLFPEYARLAGFDPNSVTFLPCTPQSEPGMLASGQVDAMLSYLVGAPTIQAFSRKQTVTLPYSDFLADQYGAVLITTTELIQTNPDLVKRFTSAFMRGLAYAVKNPDEAGAILHAAVPAQDAKAASQELTLMKQYVLGTGSGQPMGSFDQARVSRAITSLQTSNLFPPGLTPDKVIDFHYAPKS